MEGSWARRSSSNEEFVVWAFKALIAFALFSFDGPGESRRYIHLPMPWRQKLR
jgi:hypothetical protein